MHDILDAFTYAFMEVASAVVVVGGFFVTNMPTFATLLAIVWYLICIVSSGPLRKAFKRITKP